MLRATITAGILTLGSATGGLFAQASGASSPFDWSSLVGGAIGSSPAAVVLAWRLSKADRELAMARAEIKEGHEKTLSVVERAIPILAEASRTLAEVKAGMEATIKRVPSEDIARAVHQLEDLVEDLARGRGRD